MSKLATDYENSTENLGKIYKIRRYNRKRDINWSESEMRATSEKYRLNSYDGEELPFENYMKLDNTNPAPDEVAKMIKALFSIEE